MSRSLQPRGRLTMASTHIGTIADTPSRTLEALAQADLLVFEEDRPARLLLKQAGLVKPYLLYNEHAQQSTRNDVASALSAGKYVVYCSDQGVPTLADPGQGLLAQAYALGAKVMVIPGPSAITAACAACPFDLGTFFYAGFLPANTQTRQSALRSFERLAAAIVILDTPYRLTKLLEDCRDQIGDARRGFLALEIGNEQESYQVGTWRQLLQAVKGLEKQNFVLIIEGLVSAGGRQNRSKERR